MTSAKTDDNRKTPITTIGTLKFFRVVIDFWLRIEPKPAKEHPPSTKSFVTFTGSVTELVKTVMVTKIKVRPTILEVNSLPKNLMTQS
jgi:hypothetical protein